MMHRVYTVGYTREAYANDRAQALIAGDEAVTSRQLPTSSRLSAKAHIIQVSLPEWQQATTGRRQA